MNKGLRYFYYVLKTQKKGETDKTQDVTGVFRGVHIYDLVIEYDSERLDLDVALMFYNEISLEDFEYFKDSKNV